MRQKQALEKVLDTQQVSLAVSGAPDFELLLASWLASLDVRPNSKATYGRQLRKYFEWLQQTGRDVRMLELTRDDILKYREWLVEQGLSAYSVNGYLTTCRKLYTWLEAEKQYPNIAKVKGLKKPKGHRKDMFSKEQLRAILDKLDTASQEGLRDYAMLNLMMRTGLRDVEVARACVGDIRQEIGHPVLDIQGKGRDSKDEFVVLTPDAEGSIRDWLASRGKLAPDAPLFCSLSTRNSGQALTTRSISRIAKEAFKRAGFDSARLTAHSLRHTAISLAIRGGAKLVQAQAMARHSSPDTTMAYFHNLARVTEAAEDCIDF